MFRVPEDCRLTDGPMPSTKDDGNNGAFILQYTSRPGRTHRLIVVASDGEGWDHVSVSLTHRTPMWAEMDYVKRRFWDDGDTVMQLHPPRAVWVNNHPYCLHLWRPQGEPLPAPPWWMVGYRIEGES